MNSGRDGVTGDGGSAAVGAETGETQPAPSAGAGASAPPVPAPQSAPAPAAESAPADIDSAAPDLAQPDPADPDAEPHQSDDEPSGVVLAFPRGRVIDRPGSGGAIVDLGASCVWPET